MAVTQESLRSRVRELLYGAEPTAHAYEDTVQATITAGDTSLTVSDGGSWSEGDIVDFADGDQARVSAVNTNTLTIVRTAGATGHNAGTSIWRSPRFSVRQIDSAINGVLLDLYPDVYVLTTEELTYDPAQRWYPFSAPEIREVVTVYTAHSDWDYPRALPFTAQFRGVDGTEFTQGAGVTIFPSPLLFDQAKVFVVYRKEITDVTELLDRQENLVAKGAIIELLLGQTVTRTQDPGRKTDRTVQPGQEARDSIHFVREYITLRRREELRLREDESRLPKNFYAQRIRRWRP